MRLFNAIQLVVLFSLMPYLLMWLWTIPFQYALGAFWVCAIGYLILFVWMIIMVYEFFHTNHD